MNHPRIKGVVFKMGSGSRIKSDTARETFSDRRHPCIEATVGLASYKILFWRNYYDN
jgi:hypothetical protein